MEVKTKCPHCKQKGRVSSDRLGAILRCPRCRRPFRFKSTESLADEDARAMAAGATREVDSGGMDMPAAGSIDPELADTEVSATGMTSTNPLAQSGRGFGASDSTVAQCTNVGFFRSSLVAVLITAIIYWVVLLCFRSTYIGTLIIDRGRIPVVVVFLSVCSAVVLLLKLKKLREQKQSLLLDIFSGEDLNLEKIRPHDIDRLHSQLQARHGDPSRSFLLHRIIRGMEQFQRQGDVQQVRAVLQTQGDLDAAAVDSSYTMLKVIVWSVPILGFIGTVAGISESVSFFSGVIKGAQDIAEIKGSLSGVTTGLALAFDVTLIALVMSVLLMFPMNWLQKAEEDNLGAIHDYCTENFLIRLVEDDSEAIGEVEEDQARERGHSQNWLEQLEKLSTAVTHSVAEGLKQVHRQVQADHRAHFDGLEARLAKQAAAQEEALNLWSQRLGQAGTGWVERLAEGMRPILVGLEESDRRRSAETAKILGEAAADRNALVSELRPFHEQQAQLLSQASRGLGEAVRMVQADIGELERKQAQGIASLTSVLSTNLQSLQEQASRRGEAQLEALESVARRVAVAMEAIQGQAEASLREWSGAWKRAADGMGENVAEGFRALVGGLQELQARQIGSFEGEIKALRDLAEGITMKLPEQISRQVTALNAVIQGTDKLLSVEQVLAANLKTVATTEAFKKLFKALGAGVVRLGPALDKLDLRLEEMSSSLAASRAHRGWRFPFLVRRDHLNNDHE